MRIIKYILSALLLVLLLTSLSWSYTAKVEIKNAFGDTFTNSTDSRIQYLEDARIFYLKDQTDTLSLMAYYYSGEDKINKELDAKYARITEPLKDAESQPLKESDLKDRLPDMIEYLGSFNFGTQKNIVPLYYKTAHYQSQEELDLIKWAEETGEGYCLEGDAPIMPLKIAPQNRTFVWYEKYFLLDGESANEVRQTTIDYNYLMEYFCQNRINIDYYGLYKWNKHLLHTVVNKARYSYAYKTEVDQLLLAASNIYECDVERTLDIMYTMAKVMVEQERDLFAIGEERSSFWTPFHNYELVQALKPYTNASHLHHFYAYVDEDSLGKDNYMDYVQQKNEFNESNSAFVWSYSFWLRRYFEGTDHNIYNTLRAIQKDYEEME